VAAVSSVRWSFVRLFVRSFVRLFVARSFVRCSLIVRSFVVRSFVRCSFVVRPLAVVRSSLSFFGTSTRGRTSVEKRNSGGWGTGDALMLVLEEKRRVEIIETFEVGKETFIFVSFLSHFRTDTTFVAMLGIPQM